MYDLYLSRICMLYLTFVEVLGILLLYRNISVFAPSLFTVTASITDFGLLTLLRRAAITRNDSRMLRGIGK